MTEGDAIAASPSYAGVRTVGTTRRPSRRLGSGLRRGSPGPRGNRPFCRLRSSAHPVQHCRWSKFDGVVRLVLPEPLPRLSIAPCLEPARKPIGVAPPEVLTTVPDDRACASRLARPTTDARPGGVLGIAGGGVGVSAGARSAAVSGSRQSPHLTYFVRGRHPDAGKGHMCCDHAAPPDGRQRAPLPPAAPSTRTQRRDHGPRRARNLDSGEGCPWLSRSLTCTARCGGAATSCEAAWTRHSTRTTS